jgi:tol-pal system protein YbgF
MNKMTHVVMACLTTFYLTQVQAEAPVVDESNNFTVTAAQDEPFIAEKPVAKVEMAQTGDESWQDPEDKAQSNENAMLLSKVNELQRELQELRGQFEVQAHDLKLLQQQQLAFYKDLDTRLSEQDEIKNASTSKTAALDLDNSDTQKQQETPKAFEAPKRAKVSKVNPAEEQISYVSAYEFIKQKKYTQGLEAMQSFIDNYPQSHYSANAHYWLGELYFLKNNYAQAMDEFNVVMRDYPKSAKISASTLKLGYVYAAMGDINQAKRYLNQVQKLYPDTSTAQLAKTKLDDLKS